jgi:creatinine deaminase
VHDISFVRLFFSNKQIMANALFAGALPVEEQSIVPTRKTSRANSAATYRRTSQEGTISFSHVSPIAHAPFIAEAIAEARAGLAEGGIPIGCVLVRNGQVVARGHNRRIQRNSVILHAEMDCLESGGRQTAAFYKECTIYTTLSPCSMCSGAIRLYGIPRVVIGENKTFHGDEAVLRSNNIHIDVLDSKECRELLENYINENPSVWNEDIGKEEH